MRLALGVLAVLVLAGAARGGPSTISAMVEDARRLAMTSYMCEAVFGRVFVPSFSIVKSLIEAQMVSVGMMPDEATVAVAEMAEKLQRSAPKTMFEKTAAYRAACDVRLHEHFEKFRVSGARARNELRNQNSK